jgi:hypothetical protein
MRPSGRSKLAISAATVDGLPSFLMEVMAMGVADRSDISSIREWIDPV